MFKVFQLSHLVAYGRHLVSLVIYPKRKKEKNANELPVIYLFILFIFIEKVNAKRFFKNILKLEKTDDVSVLLYAIIK